jgi:hypothetical protein
MRQRSWSLGRSGVWWAEQTRGRPCVNALVVTGKGPWSLWAEHWRRPMRQRVTLGKRSSCGLNRLWRTVMRQRARGHWESGQGVCGLSRL